MSRKKEPDCYSFELSDANGVPFCTIVCCRERGGTETPQELRKRFYARVFEAEKECNHNSGNPKRGCTGWVKEIFY